MFKGMKSKRRTLWVVILVFLVTVFSTNAALPSTVHAATQSIYYVSPTGSDNNNGTSTLTPFKTITKAQSVVRTINSNMTGDIIIYLREGTYQVTSTLNFDNSDSGTNGYRVIYKNYTGETPVIDGGQVLSGTWSLYDANKNIYALTGVTQRFRQLYVNEKKAIRARTPNLGVAGMNSPNFNRITAFDKTNKTLSVASSQVSNWDNFTKVEMHLMQNWTDNIIRLSSYSISSSNAVLKFQTTEEDVLFQRPYPLIELNQCYYFENAYEFIDAEGEWYLNESTNTLYYKPRSGETLSNAIVSVPMVETIVKLAGTSTSNQMHHVTFKGITFQKSTYMRPSDYGFLDAQAGQYTTYATPSNQQYIGRPAAGVLVQCANNICFEGNTFRNMAATGLDFFYGTHDDMINGNIFYEIGGNAISLGKFTQDESTEFHIAYNPSDTNEICTNDTIINNYITNSTTEFEGACGIAAGYPKNARIEHNEVTNVNYTGISIGYGWTRVVNAMSNNNVNFNNVHEIDKVLCDAGGLYTLSNQTPSYMMNNYIHDYPSPVWGDYGSASIYIDQDTMGYHIYDNVIMNGASWGLHYNGSQDLNSANNNNGTDQNTRDFAGPLGSYYGGNGLVKLMGTAFGTTPTSLTGYEYDKAWDGNINTWPDYVGANGGITGIDLGQGNAKVVRKIRFYPRWDLPSRMNGGQFQGSNDGINYTTLYTIGATPAVLWNTAVVTNGTAFRYLRYLSPNGSYGNVAEVEFYTSNEILRTGWTATASTTLSGSSASNGIDADDSTKWTTGANQAVGDYYQVNLGSQQSISRVQMVCNQMNGSGDFPTDCSIYISTDGINWGTAVAAVTNNNFITIDKSFTPKTGQYIKVVIDKAKSAWWDVRNFRVFDTSLVKTDNVLNSGFELDDGVTNYPYGWLTNTFGNADALFTDGYDPHHGGSWHLGEYKSTAYHAWIGQVVNNLPNGTYTLSAWVRSGGTPLSRFMYIKNYGGGELQANFPVTDTWTQITITGIIVTTGTCEIGFEHNANAGNWLAIEDVSLVKN